MNDRDRDRVSEDAMDERTDSGNVDPRPGKRLGRGLAALIGDLDGGARDKERPKPTGGVVHERTVPIGAIRRNPANPRRTFDPVDLDELATSLRAHGFLSPIVVRNTKEEGAYEIVAGERRWRAAQRAELREVPVLVREVDDRLALELAIVENVQRSDLNPIDEARGYEQLIERGYTQAELSDIIGKSRSHVANTVRLMRLPDELRRMVAAGTLSAGHARALLTAPDPKALAALVVERDLTVRQTEELARKHAEGAGGSERLKSPKGEKDPDTQALERRLGDYLGAKVSIDHGRKGGRLILRYGSAEEFESLLQRLEGGTGPNFD